MSSIVTRIFDLLLSPSAASPWLGMALISCATAVIALVIFRYTSNQRGIERAKAGITAHLLEVVLYRDDLRMVLRAQLGLARDNLRYLAFALVPLLCMIIPMSIVLVQIDLRYGHRPLEVGERAIVAARLRPGVDLRAVSLSAPVGIEVETSSLRIPALHEVDWRVRARSAGRYQARITAGGQEYTKEIVIGGRGGTVAPERMAASALAQYLHPGEPALPAEGPMSAIAVSYPSASLPLLGRDIYWVWAWLALSMVAGMLLKGPLRVQV